MPTFTAIALDRLLEPGATKSVDKSVPNPNPIPKPKLVPETKLVPNSNPERRSSTSTAERKVNRPQISPALYATPESTPLPDLPSSFSPSPYIINHKGRGPRLLKSFSEDNVVACHKSLDEDKVDGKAKDSETDGFTDSSNDLSVAFTIVDSAEGEQVNYVSNSPTNEELVNGVHSGSSNERKHMNGVHDGELGRSNGELGSGDVRNGLVREKDVLKAPVLNLERESECEDFFDPQESMSYTSNTDVEDNIGTESLATLAAATPMGEFFDACEELSTEGGPQPSLCNVEAELREMRLSVLMEIEKRKLAEEALNSIQNHWERIREQLALVGLTLPVCPCTVIEGERLPDIDPAEELCRQVNLARLVSEAIGRGIAKAEMEMEMEAQIEAKDFEIARLLDRLHYYEAVNREMSQRNQEAIEVARRNRNGRKRRQRWVWGSIAAAITLGTAALAWSYLPSAKGSSSDSGSLAPDHDDSQ